jgi:hypothetical protein
MFWTKLKRGIGMDGKREAIDKLCSYGARLLALENIPDELERLGAALVSIRNAANGVPAVGRSGNCDGNEDAILTNIAHRQELRRTLRQTKNWVKTVDRALSALDSDERLAVERFYIHSVKGNVQLLCDELGVEQATVYRLRDKALRHFTMALYGIVEN